MAPERELVRLSSKSEHYVIAVGQVGQNNSKDILDFKFPSTEAGKNMRHQNFNTKIDWPRSNLPQFS